MDPEFFHHYFPTFAFSLREIFLIQLRLCRAR